MLFFLHSDSAQAGKAIPAHTYSGTFDRFFIQKLDNNWTLPSLIQILNCPGLQIRRNHYHWDGQKNTYLNVDVLHDQIIHMSLLTPEGALLELSHP